MRRELKRAVANRYMALAIVVTACILCQAYMQNQVGWKTQDVLSLITLPMALSGFTPFAGIFPCLPYSLRFADEFNSGYIRFLLTRESRNDYIWKKVLVTALAGGMMMLAAFTVVFITALLLGKPTVSDTSGFYSISPWYPFLAIWGGKFVLLLKLVLAFLFGCIWSVMCLLVSAVFMNRYVAFVGTFIIYQGLWQLLPGSLINPVYLLRGDYGGYSSFWIPVMIQLGTFGILFFTAAALMERKLKNV